MTKNKPRTIPQLVAHRGFMKSYPENTRLSILKAMDHGACFVEFDVQMTNDNKLVVIHDDTLERTSQSKGSVLEMDFSELITRRVGEPDRFGDLFTDEPIIELRTMMETISARHEVHAFVEIKVESLVHFGHNRVMTQIFSELENYRDRSTIISFDIKAVQIARQEEWSTGWVLHKYDNAHHQQSQQLQPDYLICNFKKISATQAPWPGSWQWMLYDISDVELALHYAKQGVELIETEDIGPMLEHPILRKRACSETTL